MVIAENVASFILSVLIQCSYRGDFALWARFMFVSMNN
ncbi:hypothetical protein GLA29479_2725 [Lysobacter antibioticus]|nr:hypothetical protein GLA29479_2725 [Lysobacter antibioticus]